VEFDEEKAFGLKELIPNGPHIPKVDMPWSTLIVNFKITMFYN